MVSTEQTFDPLHEGFSLIHDYLDQGAEASWLSLVRHRVSGIAVP